VALPGGSLWCSNTAGEPDTSRASPIHRALVGYLIVDGPRDDKVMHVGPVVR